MQPMKLDVTKSDDENNEIYRQNRAWGQCFPLSKESSKWYPIYSINLNFNYHICNIFLIISWYKNIILINCAHNICFRNCIQNYKIIWESVGITLLKDDNGQDKRQVEHASGQPACTKVSLASQLEPQMAGQTVVNGVSRRQHHSHSWLSKPPWSLW